MEYSLLMLMIIPPVALAAYRSRRGAGIAQIDLGLVFAGIVLVYAWLPLLGLILAQHGYAELQDQRVIDEIPTSTEIVTVGASYLAFLAGFTLVYGWLRNFVSTTPAPLRADRFQVVVVLAVAAIVFSADYMGRVLLGMDDVKSYGESYTQILQYPKEVQQIMSTLVQIKFSACLVAVVFVIAWKPHFHKYVAVAILGLLLSATFSGGSRTFGFLLAFSYVICISIYVRRFKTWEFLWMAMTGLALFIFAGVFRANNEYEVLLSATLQGGEFLSLFTNSVDLLRRAAESGGLDIPWQLYWVDILRFIPQQLLGFEKLDSAIWYVTTYYPEYYEIGGGMAFGAIAESVIGFGIAEAFARGSLLGLAYAFVANRCTLGQMTPLKVFIYVWFVVMSYQAIRDTTFSVFPRFVFQVLPVIILVSVDYRSICAAFKGGSAKMPNGSKSRP